MSSSPLAISEPWNLVADGYAETTMLVFEQFADEAIAASKLKPNATVLDVACGPGTPAGAASGQNTRHRLLRSHAHQLQKQDRTSRTPAHHQGWHILHISPRGHTKGVKYYLLCCINRQYRITNFLFSCNM
jgi:hypothetical protein